MAKVDRNVAITAMCLYEYYVESRERPFSKVVETYRTGNGSFAMRDKMLDFAKKIEDAYSALYDALLSTHGLLLGDELHEADFMSWDFDSLPHLADIYGHRYFVAHGPIHHNEIVEELLNMANLTQFSGIATLEP